MFVPYKVLEQRPVDAGIDGRVCISIRLREVFFKHFRMNRRLEAIQEGVPVPFAEP